MESIQSHLQEIWAHLDKARVGSTREIVEYIAFLLLDGKPFDFEDDFKPRKPRTTYSVDESRLKTILQEASQMVQQVDGIASELADAYLFDRYVLFYSSRLRKDTYPIPRHIVDFMLGLLHIQPDHRLADFSCGSGGFLANRDGNTVRHPGKTVGVEISQDWIRIAAANLVLHSLKPPLTTLHADNAFSVCAQMLHDDLFDRIAMAPSFGSEVNTEDVYWLTGSNGEQRSEVLFTLLALSKLNEHGKASIMVSNSMIARGNRNVRQRLTRERVLSAVIQLQSGMLQPFNEEQVYILLLNRENANVREQTWFFGVTNDGYPLLRSRNLLNPPSEEMRKLDDLPRVQSVLSDAGSLMLINPIMGMDNIQPLMIKRMPQIMVITTGPNVMLNSLRFFPPDAHQVSHMLVELMFTSTRTIYVDIPLLESDNVQDIVHVPILGNWRADLYPTTQPDETPPEGRLFKNRKSTPNQSFAVTYDGRILGISVSFSIIQAENYDLSMQNYELTTEAFQPLVPVSAAEALNLVRINQRTVARHIDNMLGRLEVPSIIGRSLPPVILKDVKDNAFVLIEDMGTEQHKIWKFIKEHFIIDDKYALYFVPEQLEENVADKVHIQHTLYLLECMGLIVQVTLQLSDTEKPLTCYRCVTDFDLPH